MAGQIILTGKSARGWSGLKSGKHSRVVESQTTGQAGLLSPPQALLWETCQRQLGGYGPVAEFKGAVPHRKFRLDIAFPDHRLAVEVDGWQHHGKHLADHRKDRERIRLLALNGWRLLPFTAGEVLKDPLGCVALIRDGLCF